MTRPKARAALFVLFLASVLVAPLWLVAFPPLLDYPNHLASAFIFTHLGDPAFRFRQFYRAEWGFYPYLAADLSLMVLERFLPAELAGRVLLSFCVLALPLAAWFFVRQANPGQDQMALWALLNAHNIFFLYGFLAFYLSVAVCFLAVGLWLRHLARPSQGRWFSALAAFTALYFTHLVSFAIAGLMMTSYSLLTRRKIRVVSLTWLLFLPGVVLYLCFSRVGAGPSGYVEFPSFAEKMASLLDVMHGYSTWLDIVTLLALAGYFLACWWRNAEFGWNKSWLGVAAILVAVYWAMPSVYDGGSELNIRLLPALFLVVLVVARAGSRGRRLATVAVLLFVVRTVNVVQNFLSAQPELAGLARSFRVTPVNARVLPIVESDEDPVWRPFTHFWAYGVIERGWLSPYIFCMNGVTLLRAQPGVYGPDGFWDLRYDQAPDWQQVRENYDYVWAYNVSRFSASLEAIGKVIYEDGDLEVFRLNRVSADPQPPRRPAWGFVGSVAPCSRRSKVHSFASGTRVPGKARVNLPCSQGTSARPVPTAPRRSPLASRLSRRSGGLWGSAA